MTNSNEPKDDTGSASTDRRNFLKAAGAAGAGAGSRRWRDTRQVRTCANHSCAGRHIVAAKIKREKMVALEMGCR